MQYFAVCRPTCTDVVVAYRCSVYQNTSALSVAHQTFKHTALTTALQRIQLHLGHRRSSTS